MLSPLDRMALSRWRDFQWLEELALCRDSIVTTRPTHHSSKWLPATLYEASHECELLAVVLCFQPMLIPSRWHTGSFNRLVDETYNLSRRSVLLQHQMRFSNLFPTHDFFDMRCVFAAHQLRFHHLTEQIPQLGLIFQITTS